MKTNFMKKNAWQPFLCLMARRLIERSKDCGAVFGCSGVHIGVLVAGIGI